MEADDASEVMRMGAIGKVCNSTGGFVMHGTYV